MKKYRSLELAIAFFMCTIAFYFGGIYFNFNFQNHFAPLINTVSTGTQNIPNAELTYADLTVRDTKEVDVLFFYYEEDRLNPDKNPTLGTNNVLLSNIKTSLGTFSQYIQTASDNNATVHFNIVSTATTTSNTDSGTPLILEIDKPATINKSSLFSSVMSELNSFTLAQDVNNYIGKALLKELSNSGNDIMLVYLDYKSYLGMDASEAQSRYESNTSGAFALEYSKNTFGQSTYYTKSNYASAQGGSVIGQGTNIENYFLFHSDVLTSMEITENAEPNLYNKLVTNFTKMMLNLYGLPNMAFSNNQVLDTTYAGNHSILSNGTYFATFNPYYAYLLGQQLTNPAPANGWLDDTYSITKLLKEGEITFEADGGDIYYIAPEDYAGQAIVLYYVDDSEYRQWTFEEGQSTPPSNGYVVVARINTKKNLDGSYLSATSSFAPFYVFEPSAINGTLTSRSSTLENARLANVGDTIGFTEQPQEASSSIHTGYVSFETTIGGSTKYVNSTLEFSVVDNSNGIKIKVDCNNSNVLLPENVAVNQALTEVQDISPDVKIFLYNDYVSRNGNRILSDSTFKQQYGIDPNMQASELKYNLTLSTSEATWEDFYNNAQYAWRKAIFNTITTHDFPDLTTLDLYGMRDITSLKFLQEINFNAVTKLCLTGTDLSQGHKLKNESPTSLEYLAVLENLTKLELNSCQIEDISFLRSLGSDVTHSKLTHISLMDNNIKDITPLNGEYLSSLSYVNLHYNQISNESLQSTYRSSTTNFYKSTAIDVGIQRMPYSKFVTQKGNMVFKAWTKSSYTNIDTDNPLRFSSTFNILDQSATLITAHDPNGINTDGNIIAGGIKLFDFEHGKYELSEIKYFSLMSEGIGLDAIVRYLPKRVLNCYFVEFSYDEEEVCQTPSTAEYLTGIEAYNNLNPLKNYDQNHFKQQDQQLPYIARTFSVEEDLTAEISGIDLSKDGDYLITYTFQFKDELKTDLFGLANDDVLADIVVSKKLKVLDYSIIEFESSDPDAKIISDPILYKTLLYISGKVEKLEDVVGLDDSKLGIERDYTLYNQDFYFFKVQNKHVPSILELRLNPPENSGYEKGVLNILDISTNAQEIIRKKLNIGKNGELPEDIISSLAGLEHMNLRSIEEINLNALGLTSINEICDGERLPRIKILNAGGNKINLISDIASLKTLEYLDLSFNLISDPTPLKQLTDPSELSGYTTQTLKKVNLSFNLISINGNSRMNDKGVQEYASANTRNQFLLSAEVPENSSFVPQNEIYIILVQMLGNFDHYGNTSKWEFYYTPALKVGNGELYNVKYARNNGTPSITTSNFSKNAGHTNFTTDAGNYAINSTLSVDLANRNNIPFKAFNRTLYYTVSKVTLNSLEKSYGTKFPSSLLLHTGSEIEGNTITYQMLTTEYADFIKNLTADLSDEDKASFFFGARKNDVSLTTTSSYWIYNAITGAGINFYDEQVTGEPIKIELETRDNSNNPNVANLNVRLTYTMSFYNTDTRGKNDQFAENRTHIDRVVMRIVINLIYNPAISMQDENLKNILLLKLNKPEDVKEIYAYDFYNIEELDLSNADIKTFDIEEGESDTTVSGFEKMIFNNLVRINLSNNLIKNTANTDSSDPLFRLLTNTTIFPTNTTLEHKIEYLDLSYNKLTSLVPLSERLFKRPITLNLFGNKIDFEDATNLAILSNADFANGALTPCRVFIGIQGLGSANLQKLVSFKKNILTSDDTYAKFVMFNGNFYIGPNDISYSFDGAEVEYRDMNNQIVLSKSDSLFTIYYYKDTFYRENQNYTVYYDFVYEDYINVELNATVMHQKMYFDVTTNEFGEEVEKDTVYKEFHSDLDLDAFNEYNKSILDEDIFIYENATALDFILDWELFDSFNTNMNKMLQSNKLTGDHPYTQHYTVTHIDSDLFYQFPKIIHIVDSTAPIIQTSSPDSKSKYVVLKGSTYAPYYANRIDKDLVFFDDYDNYYFKELINPTIKVTIIKDGEILSEVDAYWNDTKSGLSINCNNPGKYEIIYVAYDSNGNKSEPFVRTVEVYYQPYSYIKLSDFSAMFSAGTMNMTASVYKTEEDVNRNTNPIFYWYVDGKYAGMSFANPETSGNSSISTSIELYIEGSGTHTVQVFIDITKEAYEENVALGIAGLLASSTKSTSVFILMDNQVMTNTLIGIGIVIVLIIILIIVLKVVKRKREAKRNTYSYTIIKHDK